MINELDIQHLKRSVELAEEGLMKGNRPFGSVLVSSDGNVLYEDYNRIGGGDNTRHPEFSIARWAAENMTPEEREKATVYTSGEHCPMCAAAHGLVGLGRIVYASSSKQLEEWLDEMDFDEGSRLRRLPIEEVIRDTEVNGPVPELADKVKELHRKYYTK